MPTTTPIGWPAKNPDWLTINAPKTVNGWGRKTARRGPWARSPAHSAAEQRLIDIPGAKVLAHSPSLNQTRWDLNSDYSDRLLVVDITRQNPNVLYELGFAHALRKPSILISTSEVNSSPPSDLAGFQYIVYEPNHLRGLANGVQRAARVFVDRVDEQK